MKRLHLSFFSKPERSRRYFLAEQRDIYREKAFDGGNSRIDLVIGSRSFCAIIEMRIGAGNGDGQLARYASFGRNKKARSSYAEDTNGERLELKDQSAQIRSIDKMDMQCKFIDDTGRSASREKAEADERQKGGKNYV